GGVESCPKAGAGADREGSCQGLCPGRDFLHARQKPPLSVSLDAARDGRSLCQRKCDAARAGIAVARGSVQESAAGGGFSRRILDDGRNVVRASLRASADGARRAGGRTSDRERSRGAGRAHRSGPALARASAFVDTRELRGLGRVLARPTSAVSPPVTTSSPPTSS